MDNKKYFASQDGVELLDSLNKRIEEYTRYLETSGRLRQLRLAYVNYYGNDGLHSSLEMQQGGDQGELNVIKVNDYRNLIQHLTVMATANRPAVDCRATNNDAKSYEQAILGSAIVEYYLREKKLENMIIEGTEMSLVLDEASIEVTWDTGLGEDVALNPETQQPVKTGDIKAALYSPLEVIRNPYLESDNNSWMILRKQVNRFDIAAKYPELYTKLCQVGSRPDYYNLYYTENNEELNEEYIDIFTFYHEKTPALPNGRLVEFVEDILLTDGPLPYRKIPVEVIKPSKQMKTPFGYSVGRDLLGLQQVSDALHSVLATNNIRFGVQSIIGPKGADLNIQDLGAGMRYIELDPKFVDLLRPLQLTATPNTIYDHINLVDQKMETISAINSTVRGNPDTNLKSGAALALVHSTSVQFNKGLERSVSQCIENVGNLIIEHLRSFPTSKMMITIAGKTNLDKIKAFTSQDLSFVSRVVCDVSNPLSKTLAGKIEMAQDLLKQGFIKRPEQYITLLETGRFEPLIDIEMNEIIAIQHTKEAILEGTEVPVLATDNHPLYISELKGLLATADSKQNPQLVQRVLNQIQQHLNLWRSTDPTLLMVLGIQPPPPPAPVMPPAGQSVGQNPEQLANAQNPVTQQAEQVNQPNMPTNPLTGQQYNPNSGE